jgi:hypothetical protein
MVYPAKCWEPFVATCAAHIAFMEEGNLSTNNNNISKTSQLAESDSCEEPKKRRRDSPNRQSILDDLTIREITNPIGRQPQRFIHDLQNKRGFIKRLEVYNELSAHRGCVNTISWNSTGYPSPILAHSHSFRKLIGFWQ